MAQPKPWRSRSRGAAEAVASAFRFRCSVAVEIVDDTVDLFLAQHFVFAERRHHSLRIARGRIPDLTAQDGTVGKALPHVSQRRSDVGETDRGGIAWYLMTPQAVAFVDVMRELLPRESNGVRPTRKRYARSEDQSGKPAGSSAPGKQSRIRHEAQMVQCGICLISQTGRGGSFPRWP
jgi:hypothetical protein